MHQIIFASLNKKKAAEIQRMAGERIKIACLQDIPHANGIPQAEETGNSFLENALIKAHYWAEKLNLPILAEDSGLEIEALNGYPGVNTKRCIQDLKYGADVDVDQPKVLYPILLELMEKSENASKKARWISAMAFVSPKKILSMQFFTEGEMCSCAGEREFGFDQYFKPIGYSKTLSELWPSEKDSISPRKLCFESILSQII